MNPPQEEQKKPSATAQEIKVAKSESLYQALKDFNYREDQDLTEDDLIKFLDKRASGGEFDKKLQNKLFQFLDVDAMREKNIPFPEFIRGYIRFDDAIRKNQDEFEKVYKNQEENYKDLVTKVNEYKEKLNKRGGLDEDASIELKVTDVNVNEKLKGIKDLQLEMKLDDKVETRTFEMGNPKKIVEPIKFKPTSKTNSLFLTMKGTNSHKGTFTIGEKEFPLKDVENEEEYAVEIKVPESKDDDTIVAFVNADINIYFSRLKTVEANRKKEEKKTEKLKNAADKAKEYTLKVREIYGDLKRRKPDLIVNFNNEKVVPRAPDNFEINFNNEKDADLPEEDFQVDFNNQMEAVEGDEPVEVDFQNEMERNFIYPTIPVKIQFENERIQYEPPKPQPMPVVIGTSGEKTYEEQVNYQIHGYTGEGEEVQVEPFVNKYAFDWDVNQDKGATNQTGYVVNTYQEERVPKDEIRY